MACAIFVDAGYLFAQGSTALTGSKKPRYTLKLNETAAVAELVAVANNKSAASRLLRIYWYDGASSSSSLTTEHATLAHTDYIKLRLGMMNSQGEQKGVDSLIVTDLIELARNRAITDAVLLSGDEDVRIGVQIAQSFGVRVHLLGIIPSRGSQSQQLLREADTTMEWDAATVGKFLSLKPATAPMPAALGLTPVQARNVQAPLPPAVVKSLEAVAAEMLAQLDAEDIANLHTFWTIQSGLPSEYDGRLIARGRAAIGRDLSIEERRHIRQYFKVSTPAAG